MKILVLGINYHPELTGIGVYTTELCEYLAKKGHKVTVVTGFPYYPQWKIANGYKGCFYQREARNGVKIRRSPLFVPKEVTPLKRILHEVSFVITSFFSALFVGKCDLLITISPPLGLGITSIILSKIKQVPFIFHIQDLQPDAAVELGMLKNRRLLNFLYKIEILIYRQAARVSTISKSMSEKIRSKGISQEKIVFFPNWVDIEFIKPLPPDNEFRSKYGLDNKFIVMHAGNMGIKQGIEVILEAAKLTTENKDIIYLLIGDGARRRHLERLTEEMNLANLRFLPSQSREVLPLMLSAADISLVTQKANVVDIVLPSKTLGILSSGRPLIAAADPNSELSKIVAESNCGLSVEPENPQKLAEAIEKLYADKDKRKMYGENGRSYAIKNYSKDNILKRSEENLIKIKRKERNCRKIA